MKKILLTLLCLSALISCSEEDQNDDSQSEINKALIKSIEYSDDGGITYSKFLYDSLGRLEKKIDNENILAYQNFYLNNDDHQIEITEYYNSDGSISSIQNYEYDDQNRITKRTRIENETIIYETIFKRNDAENTIEIYFDTHLNKYYLNSSNKISKMESYYQASNENIIQFELTPTYDSNGNITKLLNKSDQSIISTVYEYDDKKNPFYSENSDFVTIDSKLDGALNTNPLIAILPSNNFTDQKGTINQLDGFKISYEVSRNIEYNEDDYPIKISSTETNTQGAIVSSSITTIEYL